MINKKYPSKYSNGKTVSAAQYITELICEKKAIIDKKDLYYRFWTNKEWSQFYKNQIASANKLLIKYSEIAIIRALSNAKASKIYSLRAPYLISIIMDEQKKLDQENKILTKNILRKDEVRYKDSNGSNKGILSKLKDIDNES